MSKEIYTVRAYFNEKLRLLCMLSFKYFAMRVKKCLRIASFLLRWMFSFVCSVVRLFKETNVPSLLFQSQNTLSS